MAPDHTPAQTSQSLQASSANLQDAEGGVEGAIPPQARHLMHRLFCVGKQLCHLPFVRPSLCTCAHNFVIVENVQNLLQSHKLPLASCTAACCLVRAMT